MVYEYPVPVPPRRETVARFRERLNQLLDRSGLNQSAYATRVQMDRSTLSQLLSDNPYQCGIKNERCVLIHEITLLRETTEEPCGF